jgi:mono/diheme cytochrome c family protein
MKKRAVRRFLIASTLLLLAAGFFTQAQAAPSQNESALIKRGAYLSRVGDCMACHTAPGKPPYSGGLAIKSSLGSIYPTNITPDKAHGIGNYSEQQFADAVRHGVRADGAFLYPAMPYPDYVKISDKDIHALYVYFMKGVKPSARQPPKTDLSFPFDQRWGLRFWDWFFASGDAFQPPKGASKQVARGAYLVEGLGHCGSCHTPRGFAMDEKAYDGSDEDFLAGGQLNDWPIPSLRGLPRWSKRDIVDYLQTGRSAQAAVAGEMTSVVVNSTAYMTDKDLKAIAAYLKHLGGNPPVPAENGKKVQATAAKLTTAKNLSEGQRLYLDNCGACHFVRGQGAPPAFPPLDQASVVTASEPGGLIHVILQGAQLPSTPKAPSTLLMPGFAKRLNNKEVAALATFIRQGWNNQADAVSADQVKDIRDSLKKKK